jgi:hypothetical protein
MLAILLMVLAQLPAWRRWRARRSGERSSTGEEA